MDPLFGKVTVFLSLLLFIRIRWPHGNRIKDLPVNDDRQDGLEVGLLTGATIGTVLIPILWITTSLFDFAEYPLHPVAFGIGVAIALWGLWLFYCSHKDLGTLWSPTLRLREEHHLIAVGIYSKIRHPMYAAMFLLAVAQILFLPNWFVGPTYLLTFGLLYLLRVGREERMMLDRFGEEYEAYMMRTGRLFPVSQPKSSTS